MGTGEGGKISRHEGGEGTAEKPHHYRKGIETSTFPVAELLFNAGQKETSLKRGNCCRNDLYAYYSPLKKGKKNNIIKLLKYIRGDIV